MTGWRVGYACGPKAIIGGMTKIHQYTMLCAPITGQMAAIEALKSDVSRQAAKDMTQGYRERRAVMLKLIDASEVFELKVAPQGAFYCFPSYSLDMPSVDLAKALLEEVHVATVPGCAFGACGEGYLRLSYATSTELIQEGFERMETFFRRYSR